MPSRSDASPRSKPSRVAVVLAAGKGTRMKSRHPKPLFEVAGRPMLGWVVDAAREAGCERVMVVVGHGADAIREAFADQDLVFVTQEPQLGTGHALAQAEAPFAALLGDAAATVLVLNGDVPGVRAATLERLAEAAEAGDAWGALAVAEVDEPGRLGRVVARDDESGRLARIIEAADASADELAIRRVNAGLYAVPAPGVFDVLRRLDTDNAQGELYLTDAMGLGADAGGVTLVDLDDPDEALGINDRRELARMRRILIDRHLDRLMADGVTILDPATTTIEPTVAVGRDTVIHPGTTLLGATVVGEGCTVHVGCWLRDARLADDVELKPYTLVDDASMATATIAGPFARLRPGTEMLDGAQVGNFVELKKARLGAGAKASHLTYLGDATVGDGSNIGAGVVTCNYDGVNKHRTTIGERAFVGSDTMLVAPVSVGDGATTAAGSVITQDVPDGGLGVGRARQKNIDDWAARRKRG